ncbi:MAG: ribosome silencing factor [Ruminococcus sp.]|nr:ribosome silencing factor [Ruminococcus sp.]
MSKLSQKETLKAVIKAMDSKLAEDIQLIGIRDLTIVADYFVIANGMSNTQTKAIADEVEFKLKQLGIEPLRTESDSTSTWVILDYGDIVVHVFYKETRNYYNLERLWSDGEQCDVDEYLKD